MAIPSSPIDAFTIGHGTRPLEELVATLREAGVRTLVDVRRFPGSRRNPQFDQRPLATALADAGIAYVHAVELGGRLSTEPGDGRFACIRVDAFRAYAARMTTPDWQAVLQRVVAEPSPCFLCAESSWLRCHRRLIADLLVARGIDVGHLLGPGLREPHRLSPYADVVDGGLTLCGEWVA